MAALNSGFCYAGGGFEGNAEHNGIAVCEAAVYAAGVVCNRRLGAVVTAAAVVALFMAVAAVAALVFLAVLVFPVAALVLREQVYVLGALHTGGLKAVAELNAPYAGNCKHGVGEKAFGMGLSQRIASGNLLKGGPFRSHGDHRMVMALKVASLGAAEPVEIDDTACVSKSFPSFNEIFDKL